MKMDPPAESGRAPASDKTTKDFGDKTTGDFNDRTTGSFTDHTSVTPLLLPRAKIVLWGDSLTQTSFEGWGARLADRYQRRADILNRGMSGYISTWFLQLPEEKIPNVALCTIWFGANDASLEEHNPHHFVSLENYEKNLKALVSKANKLFDKPNLLLIGPPPVAHEQRFEYQKVRYGDKATGILERTLENSGKYAEACQAVAEELDVPCVNMWEKFQTVEDWPKFLHDGLHFSKEGHDFVFQCLEEAIATHYPSLTVTPCPHTGQACNSGSKCIGLPTFGPYHDQINAKEPDVAMKQAFKDLALGSGKGPAVASSPSTKKPKMDAP
jgi:isoamyl acetate esterase